MGNQLDAISKTLHIPNPEKNAESRTTREDQTST